MFKRDWIFEGMSAGVTHWMWLSGVLGNYTHRIPSQRSKLSSFIWWDRMGVIDPGLLSRVTNASNTLPPSCKNVLDLLILIAPSTCIAHHSIFSSGICLNCVWDLLWKFNEERGGRMKKKNHFTFDVVLNLLIICTHLINRHHAFSFDWNPNHNSALFTILDGSWQGLTSTNPHQSLLSTAR